MRANLQLCSRISDSRLMTQKLSAETIGAPDACRLAGLSSDQFRGLVYGGQYTAGPPGLGQGTRRQFTINDVVALAVLADALRAGVGPSAANNYAHAVKTVLQEDCGAETVLIGEIYAGKVDRAARMVFGTADDFDVPAMSYRGQPLAALRTIATGALRRRLATSMAEVIAMKRPVKSYPRRTKPVPTLQRAVFHALKVKG